MFFDKKFIGQKFKEYRKKLHYNQEKVAEKTGIAEKHYGRLERGTCMPTLETFFKIIDVLKIPLSEFGKISNLAEDDNRNNLIREIYLFNNKELEILKDFINVVKKLR